ncbi:endonuclease/exonuclease/phosphatase family protein [Microbacterium sp. B19]|uniref:endonuclease/exonuclease/phosphatase family protein n=1 Tax=Microbacterium sp. B19 TaxID=96765 RepID=UPI0003B3D229|nr:endonuclease/exonuclease/phosphatase family protein [Microbacterium sp. B19]
MPTASRRRLPLLITLLVAGLLAVLVVWPQLIGAERWQGVALLISFRAPVAIGFAALAVVAGIVALLRRRAAVALGLAVVCAAVAVGNGAVLLARGWGGSVAEGDLTVAVWNTYGGGASPDAIARLVRESGADVVSLPETDSRAAAEVVGILERGGIRMTAATVDAAPGDRPVPTSLLVADALGPYVLDPAAGSTPGAPSGVWRPVDGTGPTLVAAHPLPPLPFMLDDWTRGIDWIAAQCARPDVILAGDLNSTLDHLSGLGRNGGTVGECEDAAREAGAAARGTWPVDLPTALAAPIDHILVGSAWEVRSFEVRTDFDDAGSDHRPVVAVLSRR